MAPTHEREVLSIIADEIPPGVRRVGHEESPLHTDAPTLSYLHVTQSEWETARKLYNDTSRIGHVLQVESWFTAQGDFETLTHMRRVSLVAVLLAQRLGHPANDLETLMLGTRVHDAGKVDARVNALLAEPHLTNAQRFVVSTHVDMGLYHPHVTPLAPIIHGLVGYHHTYKKNNPYGADESMVDPNKRRIDLEEILAISDAYDALIAKRGYRKADYAPEAALQQLYADFAVDRRILTAMRDLLRLDPEPIPAPAPTPEPTPLEAARHIGARILDRILDWLR